MENKLENINCSFCGKSSKQVEKMIASPSGASFICNECVNYCIKLINEEDKAELQIKSHVNIIKKNLNIILTYINNIERELKD